jgi:hypothetical protein
MNPFANKITNKKRTELQGDIIFPLIAGQKARISYNDQMITTSTVVAILEVSEQKIVIETKNTVYCVVPVYSNNEVEAYIVPNTEIYV